MPFISFPLSPSFSEGGIALWSRELRSGEDDEGVRGGKRQGTHLNSQADSMAHLVPGPCDVPGFE